MDQLYFIQLQPRSSVHDQLAFLQPHLTPQPFLVLHPHFISSEQVLLARGRVVQTGVQDRILLSQFQPQPSGLGLSCFVSSLVVQTPA